MLKVEIRGIYKGSGEYYPVNTLVFKKKSAGGKTEEITLDRSDTEFTAEDDRSSEVWKNVYIWDGTENFDYDDDIVDGAELTEVCLDDDMKNIDVMPEAVTVYSTTGKTPYHEFIRQENGKYTEVHFK